MYQFIESICCVDGELLLLDLHQARVNRTFFTNYGFLTKPMVLARIIRQIPSKGKYKCRVLYNNDQFEIEFVAYKAPKITSLQIVEGGDIDYRYKFADRSALDSLFGQRKGADDMLIVKNGQVTDSYYANLAFFDGDTWWTPEEPLLGGVQRQNLLDQRHIKTAQISLTDILKYEKVSLINAMNQLGEVVMSSSDIEQ